MSEGERLTAEWSEHGGPVIDCAPSTSGFGTRLSRDTIVGQLGGTLNYDWQPAGLAVTNGAAGGKPGEIVWPINSRRAGTKDCA
jgi:hypothetical protein